MSPIFGLTMSVIISLDILPRLLLTGEVAAYSLGLV